MATDTSRYPGLAPPTPQGRRSRCASGMSTNPPPLHPGGGGAPGDEYGGSQQLQQPQQPQQGAPHPVDLPPMSDRSARPDAPQPGSQSASSRTGHKDGQEPLNFGWFSVQRGGGEPKGEGEVSRAASRSSGMGGGRGAGEPGQQRPPSNMAGRSSSRQSCAGAGEAIRSSSRASALGHGQGEVMRSSSRSSKMGQSSYQEPENPTDCYGQPCSQDYQIQDQQGQQGQQGQQSQQGQSQGHPNNIPGFYDQGPAPEPAQVEDIIIDWPISSTYRAIMQQQQGQQGQSSYRPSSRAQATRCPSRSGIPPTPLPPIAWNGYRDASSRPTVSKWRQQWHNYSKQGGQYARHGHQSQSDQMMQLMCPEQYGYPGEGRQSATIGQRRHAQYDQPEARPRGYAPQGCDAAYQYGPPTDQLNFQPGAQQQYDCSSNNNSAGSSSNNNNNNRVDEGNLSAPVKNNDEMDRIVVNGEDATNNNSNNSADTTTNIKNNNNNNNTNNDTENSTNKDCSGNNNSKKRLLDGDNKKDSKYDGVIAEGSKLLSATDNNANNNKANISLQKPKKSALKTMFSRKPQTEGFYKPSNVVDWNESKTKKQSNAPKPEKSKIPRSVTDDNTTKTAIRRAWESVNCLPLLIHKLEKIRNKRKAFKFQKFQDEYYNQLEDQDQF